GGGGAGGSAAPAAPGLEPSDAGAAQRAAVDRRRSHDQRNRRGTRRESAHGAGASRTRQRPPRSARPQRAATFRADAPRVVLKTPAPAATQSGFTNSVAALVGRALRPTCRG